ncbi:MULTISPECIES: putative PEP-binding protein [unclassified Aliivibrio]|uniref:putative PEP-binding protein n=1 Tax=unclassified Aliivibrio TaxID=2645654 RepID=UPI00080E8385|nr:MULTISPECIES: putative PEP-binding protein [unclassified Aliivibrio]OCH17328.1 phosphoenolpyruvate synthase [Aliivibrio sp. 1S128]OCH18785.1 phosphoenolpyruvate synthase [Aliivibrio sp. 1S165]OCH31021.1 phosphoenolpyruvate synthase [Aliivibrio sp. 1S175]
MTDTILSTLTRMASLPSYQSKTDSTDSLYVSIAGLIQEHLFYHPKAVIEAPKMSDIDAQSLALIIESASDGKTHFIDTLTEVILASITEETKEVKISFSDADSAAFGSLLIGQLEAKEVNPMMGVRGVTRFASDESAEQFALECAVIKKVMEGTSASVQIVVPFVRNLSDAATIIDRLAIYGLPRGLNGLKVHFVCDVPAAALMADKLLQYFDGMVVNVDTLTQFTLGVDKQNEALEHHFDPQNEAVLHLVGQAIQAAKKANKPVVTTIDELAQNPKVQELLDQLSATEVVVTA